MNETTEESPVDAGVELSRLRAENEILSRRIAQLERKLSLQPQTGLPTHFRLELELEETIDAMRGGRDGSGFSILIIQLGETYSVVRKTLKSSVSEWILYQMGCRISGLLDDSARVFHTRENEFVLILPGLKGPPLAGFIKRLFAQLGEPHIFSGFNVAIQVAMGAAYWPEHGTERSALLHNADIAAGFATDERRPFVLFKPQLLRKAVEKVELQNAIIKAIERPALDRIGEQFVLYYQPKLIASAIEGHTIKVEKVEAEALIRWDHPTKGLLSPSTFIPLAEETGLILPLGKWLIYQTARDLQSWNEAGKGRIPVSINLSARQFRSEEIPGILTSAMTGASLAPGQLTVELTETSLFEDPASTSVILERFSALGIRVSVDDFGTGYSSLSHLHRFPLDEIKIDRLFIENIDSNRQDRIIVRSLVAIAKGLGLSLVAEGVEKAPALEILWEMGCRGFQGYLIARPLPADAFIAFCDKLAADGMSFTF
ncbi:MAG TPA: bifunctional diguanylate cyclase/phosphodiesterase [Rectinemataceae bacterium]|nr:bifunctional diguanylate cyclase/phosphodiesterase [Rectinemataceae bacterium]